MQICLLHSNTDIVLDEVNAKLEEITEAWEDTDLLGLLHTSRDKLGMSTKNFMRVLRLKLTGMKVRNLII